MTLLVIETATRAAAVGIAGDAGVVASARVGAGPRHGELLVPMVERLCAWSGVALSELEAVAVDAGPGLFTGLRVGASTAKALGRSLDVPVVGISSLDALAWPVRHCTTLLATVIDARRGQVYWALHRGGARIPGALGEDRVGPPEELAGELSTLDEPCLAVGDGAERFGGVLSVVPSLGLAGRTEATPRVSVLAELARAALAEGRGRPAAELVPRYVRPPDARVGVGPSMGGRPGGGA
ncbi:MAG: tRNA (adenosine(37)-N6)-threonylcarbamoyltransferase complex dimerization subunit type 1 TsaB [Acidimicrobiales bacterium]